MLGTRFACVLLGAAVLSCSGGLSPDDESDEGEGGEGGEHATLDSDRPLLDGPELEPDSVVPRVLHPSCVTPYNVTLAVDPLVPPASCNDPGALTPGTLRHAIACANELPNVDTITSTISGLVQLNDTCKALVITRSVTWASSLSFWITGTTTTFGDLIRVNGTGITVNSGNLRLVGGAGQRGIRVIEGTLNLSGAYISGMRDPADWNGSGAGILVANNGAGATAVGNLSLYKSNISNNWATTGASSDGGGLYFNGTGTLQIRSSLFEGNRAKRRGGGIVYAQANAFVGSSIISSTITHNVAEVEANGIAARSAVAPPLVIENSTISENYGGGYGIGVHSTATVHAKQCTIADNTSVSGTAAQLHNAGGSVQVTGSILRGTAAACSGTPAGLLNISGGSNVWHDSSCPSLIGLSGTNALIGLVASNGGGCDGPAHQCKTQKPQPGSPANNAATACLPTDQRGASRGAAPCWAGAYEN